MAVHGMISVRMLHAEVWQRAPLKVRALPSKLREKTDRILSDVVDAMRDNLVNALRGEESALKLRLRELTEDYIRRKGHGERLRDSDFYINHIDVVDYHGSKGVGVAATDHPTGLALRGLARYLEYGTVRMAPLPHWRPTAEFGKRVLRKRIQELLNDAVRIS